MQAELARALALGLARPIDVQFARFCAERAGGDDPDLVALTACALSARTGAGDVCLDLARLAGRPLLAGGEGASALRLCAPPLERWLEALGRCPWVGRPGERAPMILDGGRLYLGRYWAWESDVAMGLRARLARDAPVDEARLRHGLERLFGPLRAEGVDWQRVAAALACLRDLAVITGGPGTGKTTTMVRILALMLDQRPDLHVRLLAPTGKAAARMTEAVRRELARLELPAPVRAGLPTEAATVHRFLRPDPEGRFRHHRDNPVPADVVVLDEASMVPLQLMARLLDALLPRCRLVLLGDRDQLGPVEAGHVFADLCGGGPRHRPATAVALARVGAVPTPAALAPDARAPEVADAQVGLTEGRRFGATSGIGRLAAAVRAGAGADAYGLEAPDLAWSVWLPDGAPPPAVAEWLRARLARVREARSAEEALARLAEARVLCTVREGPAGVAGLNALAERVLGVEGGDYPGRPVIVTRNDYLLELYNGDTGVLWPHPGDPRRLAACFEDGKGGIRHVPLQQLPAHETAYALTVHRAQGSEYEEVLLVLPAEPVRVLARELLYTGITRARRGLHVLASRAAWEAACARAAERSSGLAARLGW